MEAMEPMMHNNKRYRTAQDQSYAGAATYAPSPSHPQSFSGPGLLTNQRSGSSDRSSGSDHGANAMSRSVSDSSLALPQQDSRSSSALPPYPQYQALDPAAANQQILLQSLGPSSVPLSHAPLPNPANVLPFQENAMGSSVGRGPPSQQHLTNSFNLPNNAGPGSCLPAHSGPLSSTPIATSPLANSSLANAPLGGGHMASGPAGPAYSSTGFAQQPHGNLPSSVMSHPGMSYPAGLMAGGAPPLALGGGPLVPTLPSVPKWDAANSGNASSSPSPGAAAAPPPTLEPPCAACKSLRRKCTRDCIFLPYFPRDDPEKFARVHKVFGASNVAKMLQDLPVHQREDTVASLEYEAQARVQDPVFGCVGILCLLQKQIAMLQGQVAELQRQPGVPPRAPLQSADALQGSMGNSIPQHQTSMSSGSIMAPHT